MLIKSYIMLSYIMLVTGNLHITAR